MSASLKRFCPEASLWILCLDTFTWDLLQRLQIPGIHPIRLEHLEGRFPELVSAKGNRNLLEYYFTCTPAMISFVLDRNPELPRITYLDADLYFFSDPGSLFQEIGSSPIAVVEHRYSPGNRDREQSSGRFNVSWVTFRREAQAMECLESWRRQCLEWCYDRVEAGLFGDQRYLDRWPELYPGLLVIQHAGAGCAPWNVDVSSWSRTDDAVLVDGVPLCFFHFHGIRRVSERVYDPVLAHYGTRMNRVLRRDVYRPYVACLLAVHHAIFGMESGVQVFDNLRRELYPKDGPDRPLERLRNWISVTRRLVTGEYLLIWNIRSRVKQMRVELARWIPALVR